jgi:arylformamidase
MSQVPLQGPGTDSGQQKPWRLVDLSHVIDDGMTTYPGLPGPLITTHVSRQESARSLADGLSFEIAAIQMVANTGTYLDAPLHYYAGRPDVAGLALDGLVDIPAIVIRAGSQGPVDLDLFPDASMLTSRAVLIHTGHSRLWGTEAYFDDSPYLGEDAVELLVAARVRLVGIDSLNIDDPADTRRPAHKRLLGEGIPIIEHLTALENIRGGQVWFTAVPAPVRGMGSFPVRAFARVPGVLSRGCDLPAARPARVRGMPGLPVVPVGTCDLFRVSVTIVTLTRNKS